MNKSNERHEIEYLPDSELTVMNVIWSSKIPIGTGKIMEQLSKNTDWSRSTIQVLLTRLTERGFISMEKEGRLKYYTPLIKEQDYQLQVTRSFVAHIYHNSYQKLIKNLIADNSFSDADYDDFLSLIQHARTN